MQKKKIVTIILTVAVFFAVAFVGVVNVFRVEDVVLSTNVLSEEANAEAQRLRDELQEFYRGESSILAKEDGVKEILERYPYFHLTSFTKAYPNKLLVEVSETPEVFAVQVENRYYILSATGTILRIRAESDNRGDAAPNVLVTGVTPEGREGEQVRGEGVLQFLKICQVMAGQFGGIRSNLERAEVVPAGGDFRLRLYMREGVEISVRNPAVLTEEKAMAISKMYLEMSDEQRLTGKIYVVESLDGTEVMIDYRPND